jgi:hypothetical protein
VIQIISPFPNLFFLKPDASLSCHAVPEGCLLNFDGVNAEIAQVDRAEEQQMICDQLSEQS